MGYAFKLQVASGRFGVVLLLHGPDDIVGVSVVPFDEIGVVAVDDAQQFAQGLQGNRVLPGAAWCRALPSAELPPGPDPEDYRPVPEAVGSSD